jgi:endogenous inhibitor of DNA gyrase (YacG/DUF329 family)
MTTTVRLVPCPTCKTPTAFSAGNRWRPFCSERCRNADLGAWASESYRVAAEAPKDGDEPPSPTSH